MAVKTKRRLLTTSKAIAEGIAQEMERDPAVFVMGEDIGAYGGIFGATEGLLAKFGPERIMDTPISETGFIGAATGAALSGMRPIAELMFVDFFGVCMDQIYNHMAKIHYESGGNVRVPVVVTTAIGGGYGDGAQHSQTLYGTFAHLPGMKIVVPSTPYDAKGLMISAIRDDNPVIYMFHKGVMGLGWMTPNPRATGPVPEEPYTVPIGKADVKREGRDLTIVTWGATVQKSLDAAEQLAAENMSLEVIDLRSLIPWDKEAVAASVARTSRLLVVHEDVLTSGFGAEVAAWAGEACFRDLDAPISRLGATDTFVAYEPTLERAILPQTEGITAAARALLAY